MFIITAVYNVEECCGANFHVVSLAGNTAPIKLRRCEGEPSATHPI